MVFKCQADRNHNTEAELAALTSGTFSGDGAEPIGLPGLAPPGVSRSTD